MFFFLNSTYFSERFQSTVQDLTSEEEENQHHDESVAKVQEGGGCSSDCQLGAEEMNRVQEEIHRSTAPSQERPPPPVIILRKKEFRTKSPPL